MTRRSIAALLGGLVLLVSSTSASAWTRQYHEQVAVQGARLMPGSLQRVLAKHQDRLRAGATAPLNLGASESLYLHAGGSYGSLDESILVQSQRVLDLLQARSGFDIVAYEMGVLSHLTALANSPTNVAADDPREAQWGPRFQSFTESRIPKFRVVFDGYLTPALARDDVRGFARGIADRSRRHYPLIARAYLNDDGSVKTNASFSDQHAVFGVASLAYSRSIADTAKIWLYLWIKADGDTTDLPFPQGLSQPTLVKANRE